MRCNLRYRTLRKFLHEEVRKKVKRGKAHDVNAMGKSSGSAQNGTRVSVDNVGIAHGLDPHMAEGYQGPIGLSPSHCYADENPGLNPSATIIPIY